AVEAVERYRVGDGARRDDVQVEVAASDVRVEVDELRRRDQPFAQALQAVLDPDVVEPASRPAAFVATERVDHVVLQRAAHALRVGLRVVDLVLWNVRAGTRRVAGVRDYAREGNRVRDV